MTRPMFGNSPRARSDAPAVATVDRRRFQHALWPSLVLFFQWWLAGSVYATDIPSITPLMPPFPGRTREISCNIATAPLPESTPDGIRFTAPFQPGIDRVYWDISLPKIPPDTTTLLVDLDCANPAAIRAVSIHLNSGAGWYSIETSSPSTTHRQTLSLPRAAFHSEGAPAAWNRARRLRLSLWKRTDQPVTVTLRAVSARCDVVAVVQASDATAPGETAFARQLVTRTTAALTKAGIPFTLIGDTFEEDLPPLKLLLLPWSPALDEQHVERLDHFARSGGKIIVFYNASTELAQTLGMTIGPWQGAAAGREWLAWTNVPLTELSLPLLVSHRTTNLLPPRPALESPYQARTLAVWTDTAGRPTDLPACVISTRGAWFAHVPPLATASASDFMRSIVGTLLPDLGHACAVTTVRTIEAASQEAVARHTQTVTHLKAALAANDFDRVAQIAAQRNQRIAAATLAAGPRPATNEIRAVWENGTGRLPSGIDAFFADIARHKINTVFFHMQSAGYLHLKNTSDLPLSTRGQHLLAPRLADTLAAAQQNEIALHAWTICWSVADAGESWRAGLEESGRLMHNALGNTIPWLCPSIPQNQTLILDGLVELAKQGVAGIHFDYVRYPDEQGCFAPASRQAFERVVGQPVAAWPRDVLAGGSLAAAFQTFRQNEITRFIRAASAATRAINPGIVLSAAVFPNIETARALGQDWPTWLREKSLDYVCPMPYTENTATFNAWLDAYSRTGPDLAAHLVIGLGTGADESQLDARGAAEQVVAVRTRGLRGFAFFTADGELLQRILPALDLAP